MLEGLRPVSTATCPCKICGGPAALYGVVDFHKSCAEGHHAARFALSGVPIYYRRCASCKFLFTDAFDDWSIEHFKTYIYNDEYRMVDPDYETVRPTANAENVVRLWGAIKGQSRLLDYGGGNDTFCAALREHGFPVALSYDPMVPQYAQRPEGKFNLVTCFETIEHLPDPNAGIMRRSLNLPPSTGLHLLHDLGAIAGLRAIRHELVVCRPAQRPRLDFLESRHFRCASSTEHGYKLVSFNDNISHIAFHTLPPFPSRT